MLIFEFYCAIKVLFIEKISVILFKSFGLLSPKDFYKLFGFTIFDYERHTH
jgi:hypothetical protein